MGWITDALAVFWRCRDLAHSKERIGGSSQVMGLATAHCILFEIFFCFMQIEIES